MMKGEKERREEERFIMNEMKESREDNAMKSVYLVSCRGEQVDSESIDRLETL